jgi:hypothetical protein
MVIFSLSCAAEVGKYTETRELSLPAYNISTLMIKAGAGDLDISPAAGATILVTAKIEIGGNSQEQGKATVGKYVEITLDAHSTRATLNARMLDTLFLFLKRFNGIIHLSVAVPAGMTVEVEKTGGNLYMNNCANPAVLNVTGTEVSVSRHRASLNLTARGAKSVINVVSGSVTVDHGAKDLEISGVSGSVTVKDGDGDIRISGISGTVNVIDAAGAIVIENVGGKVTVENSGSGKVDITGAQSGFELLK